MSGGGADREASIDGLRGVAALMVVVSHASGMGLHVVPGVSMSGIGKHGVYLFFAISAYLLTAQWLRECSARVLLPYLARRFLRIYPLYTAVLLAGWWLAPPTIPVPRTAGDVGLHLLLLEGDMVYWSIPVEFKYYLLIPLVGLFWTLPVRPLAKLAALVGLALLTAGLFPGSEAQPNSLELGYYLPVLLAGSIVAAIVHGARAAAHTETVRMRRGWGHVLDGFFVLALVLGLPPVLQAVWPEVAPGFLNAQILAWGLFWGLLLWAVGSGVAPGWCRVMRQPLLRACGRWCFGIYLLHIPCLLVAKRLPFPSWACAWAGLALSVVVAAVAFRLIERPFIRLGARLP